MTWVAPVTSRHRIELEPDAKPFKEPLRKLNPQKRRVAEEQMEIMRQAGAIQPSHSPFASAIVLAPKADGSLRFCIDFRRLNKITIKDSFPLPRIDDTLENLGAARFFTSLDMGSAFWQIPMEDDSIKYTAFASTSELWEFRRMPFGLCNATATFQRLMNRILSGVNNTFGSLVLCYVDDILIATATAEEHIRRLERSV